MGQDTAKFLNFFISGGASAVSDDFKLLDEGGKKKGRASLIGQKDARKATRKDVSKKTGRTALVAGQSRGILNIASTSGRGTLLGN